jgi:uncharacterized protein (TIGR03435 family)
MLVRFLALLLTAAVAHLFGQPGTFRPVSSYLKAGDLAPDIGFTNVLSTPGSSGWNSANLAGQMTVLAFYPDTSHNLQSVSRWNALVERFVDRPVQFAWITQEDEASLLPWLQAHPVKGSVLHDPNGTTWRSYGLELPAAVIIGVDRRIVGFDREMIPTADTLKAALEGRIITTPLKPGTPEFKAFVERRLVLLDAEPPRMPRPDDHKPDFPPSYTLHVSPAKLEGGGNYGGSNFVSFQGFDLKGIISELYNLNPVRIQLPAPLDDGKGYDFDLVLPEPDSKENIYNRIRQGIQEYFHLKVARENRVLDAYVVTAPNPKPAMVKAKPEDESATFKSSSIEFEVVEIPGGPDDLVGPPKAVTIGAIRSISMQGTIDELCHRLEGALDRPVVNETKLDGEFDFQVKTAKDVKSNFLERLRDQFGLVITSAPRSVEILVFNPKN